MTAVREATAADLPAVATVLDAALLERPDTRERVEAGDVLVAVDEGTGAARAGGGTVLGAAVLVPPDRAPAWVRERGADAHLAAVAVRRRRRGQGLGTALVEAAGERGRLTAAFDDDRRPFYESLGFVLDADDGGRIRGVRDPR